MLVLCNLSTAALVLPTIIFFFIKKWKKSKNRNVIKLPPGPITLPIIGNLHQISSPPFRCFTDLAARHGPIMYLRLGEAPAVVVSSPEIAMLKDLDPSFANRPKGVALEIMWYGYLDIAFSPYGDYWRQMRKICINELLSPRMVRSFRSIRRDEAARLVDFLRESSGSSVNLTEKIFSFSSSITCRAAFGGVCNDREGLIKVMMETLRMAGGFEIADFFPSSRIVTALSWTKMRLKRMRRKLDVILDDVIDEHKENLAENAGGNGEFGSEDFVDVLLRMKEEGGEELNFPIGNDNIKAVLYDIFSAGTETSSSAIDWTIVELMKNTRVMAKAQAELRQVLKEGTTATTLEQNDVVHKLKYLKLVIKESLRLHPPVPMLPRASREACKVKGYTIPADVRVMVNIWAMHRDPNFWKDPERFEPERFENDGVDFTGGDFQYLPFGSGRRMCPGIMFGLATVELALAQLLYNFDWKLPEGVRVEDLDMIENDGITTSRKDNLFVVATPYKPSM
ncbi:premnaspirodiene oxygenase-like [Salvia miltiorrhiza]|uniref:premnaspirodiene oxygenase-like n=1 Tax=Salvia miltiorrhiza TaxID=226208 RepID=UPI0025ACDE47|nr:premnaspirodiene oxygenase-like [Salvia miltiorrhiza]